MNDDSNNPDIASSPSGEGSAIMPVEKVRRRVTRRRFLASAAALGAAGVGTYYAARARVGVGLVGAGGRGSYHAWLLNWMSYCLSPYGTVLAVCDVDVNKARAVRDASWPRAEVYQDYRKLLENQDVQAVFVVTNDHWHTAIAVDAMQAGKDVYLEKPISLTIDEALCLRDTADKTGAVVQVGTQQRSHSPFHIAWELVQNQRLGKLQKITVTLDSLPPPVPGDELSIDESQPSKSLDWDLWLGPTSSAPYCTYRHHGWWGLAEYSGGMITNWGAHHLDIALWASGMDTSYPEFVDGNGSIPHLPLGTGLPSDFTVSLIYPEGPPIKLCTTEKDHGILFDGDRGRIFVNRARVAGKPVEELSDKPLPSDAHRLRARRMPGPRQKLAEIQHYRDFFDCIASRNAPIANLNSSVCVHTALHLANISIAVGRPLTFDASTMRVVNDPEAMAMCSRPRREPYTLPSFSRTRTRPHA